jgi:hypothetical protein
MRRVYCPNSSLSRWTLSWRRILDARTVSLVGHSRRTLACMVAWAIIVSAHCNQQGCGGAINQAYFSSRASCEFVLKHSPRWGNHQGRCESFPVEWLKRMGYGPIYARLPHKSRIDPISVRAPRMPPHNTTMPVTTGDPSGRFER